MLFNFDQPITRLNGAAFTLADVGIASDDPAAPLTLRAWSLHTLLDVLEIESRDQHGRPIAKQLSESEKFNRYQIAEAIAGSADGIVDLTVAQRETLKHCTHVAANVEVLGRVYRMLEEVLPPKA